MVNSSKSTLKKALVLGAAAIAATLLSGCDAMTASGTYDRDISYEFSSPRDKDAQTTLPSWVPENAKDIQMAQRTTGNERLLTFQSEAELPPSCLTLDSPGAPSPDQRGEGLAQESSKTNNELQSQVNSQHLEPLIETDGGQQTKNRKPLMCAENGGFRRHLQTPFTPSRQKLELSLRASFSNVRKTD